MKKIVEFFKVRNRHRKNLIFLWKNIDKRWRVFAACYVRPYTKEYAKTIQKNVDEIEMFNRFIPNIVLDKIKHGSLMNYGFLNKDRVVRMEDLNFKSTEVTLGDVDKINVGKL